MAVTPTYRVKYHSTTASASMATDTTYTPAANSLSVVFVCNSLASSPLDPTGVTGHGVTYTQVTLSARLISTTHTCSMWVAKMGASPTTTAVTAAFNSVNQTGGTIIEYEVTGHDNVGTALQAIVQAVTTNGTSNNVTATNLLAAATNSDDRAIAFWIHLTNEAGGTYTNGNWTSGFAAAGFNVPATTGGGQHTASTFDRSPQASWTTSAAYRVVAVEIKSASATTALVGTSVDDAAGTLTPGISIALVAAAALPVGTGTITPSIQTVTTVALTTKAVTANAQPLATTIATTLTTKVVTANAQTLAPGISYTVALAGASVATSAGTVAAGTATVVALIGAAVSASGGLLATTISTALTTQAVTATPGLLGAGVSYTAALTTKAVTASAGLLAPTISTALTTKNVTVTPGLLAPTISTALTTKNVTAAAGLLGTTISASVALTGQAVTVGTGALTPQTGGGVTFALVGTSLSVGPGALAPSASVTSPLTTKAVTASKGLLGITLAAPLSSQSVSVTPGILGTFVSLNANVTLVGQAVVVDVGLLTVQAGINASVALDGCVVSVQSGRITIRNISSKTRNLLFVSTHEEDLVA